MRYIRLMLLMTMVLNFLSCERRFLEEEIKTPDGAKIPVTIYWERANIIPQNVTVLVYKEDGDLFLETFFENAGASAYTEIYLPVGTYSIISFNEKRDQIDYVRIRGYENLSTLEAYATTASAVYDTQSKSGGESIVEQPGRLAVAKTTVTVNEDDVELWRKHAINQTQGIGKAADEESALQVQLWPVLKIATVNITVHVAGLNNARMPALTELKHMAGGYLLGMDKNTSTPVTTQFMLNNRSYNSGSKTEGTISTVITSFGIPGNRNEIEENADKIQLDLAFQLVDKERTIVSFSLDVTKALKIAINENGVVTIDLDINQLSFPEVWLPDVIPEGGNNNEGGSGITSDLIDWDTIIVPIPL